MERKKITILDILVVVIIFVLAVVMIITQLSDKLNVKKESMIVVKRYGEIIEVIDLPRGDGIFTDDIKDNFVICYDKDGVWVKSSNCRDKLCISQGKLTNSAGALICLPSGYSISLSSSENEIDGVVK